MTRRLIQLSFTYSFESFVRFRNVSRWTEEFWSLFALRNLKGNRSIFGDLVYLAIIGRG